MAKSTRGKQFKKIIDALMPYVDITQSATRPEDIIERNGLGVTYRGSGAVVFNGLSKNRDGRLVFKFSRPYVLTDLKHTQLFGDAKILVEQYGYEHFAVPVQDFLRQAKLDIEACEKKKNNPRRIEIYGPESDFVYKTIPLAYLHAVIGVKEELHRRRPNWAYN